LEKKTGALGLMMTKSNWLQKPVKKLPFQKNCTYLYDERKSVGFRRGIIYPIETKSCRFFSMKIFGSIVQRDIKSAWFSELNGVEILLLFQKLESEGRNFHLHSSHFI